jgi:hypothetical protein
MNTDHLKVTKLSVWDRLLLHLFPEQLEKCEIPECKYIIKYKVMLGELYVLSVEQIPKSLSKMMSLLDEEAK